MAAMDTVLSDAFRNRLMERLALRDSGRPVVCYDGPREVWRPAAVLIPLIPREGRLQVLLTRRSDDLREHAGQISFPGGCIEDDDHSPESAALREAREEVGLSADRVEVLGALAPYGTGTGFVIHPFVGLVENPGRLVPDPAEVAEIFEVPLDFFLDPRNLQIHVLRHNNRQYRLPAMPYKGYYIWGATAGILRNLCELMRDA